MSRVNGGMLKMDITEMPVNNNGNKIAESDRKNSEQRFLYSKSLA